VENREGEEEAGDSSTAEEKWAVRQRTGTGRVKHLRRTTDYPESNSVRNRPNPGKMIGKMEASSLFSVNFVI